MGKIKDLTSRIFHKRSQAPPAGNASDSDVVQLIYDELCKVRSAFIPGYITLDTCPEIQTGIMRIAQLVSIMPIHLMENGERADRRVTNELSRLIDIEPSPIMTRQTWIQKIVADMLIHGNAYVLPITRDGLIRELRPLPYSSVTITDSAYDYEIQINGRRYDRDDVLNFVYNPDPNKPWRGRGLTVALNVVADSLAQTRATEDGLKQNPIPPIIVLVKALIEELQTPEGRDKIERAYLKRKSAGQPWILPAEGFDVKELRPMSLKDLAIPESFELGARQAAAIIGVPAFILGAGQFNRDEWNLCVSTTIPPITQAIEQELTRKLLLNPKWHYVIDFFKLLKYDLDTLRSFVMDAFDRGAINGNEIRAVIGYDAEDGLDEYKALENYIPADRAGDQKKLKEGGDNE